MLHALHVFINNYSRLSNLDNRNAVLATPSLFRPEEKVPKNRGIVAMMHECRST